MKTKLFSLLAAAAVFAAASGYTEPASCVKIKNMFPTKKQWLMAVDDNLCLKLTAAQKTTCERVRLDRLLDGKNCTW